MRKGNLQAPAAVLCDFSICFCETAITPMSFMACCRRLDQTGMCLKNEYSVFKGHSDFRPYKMSFVAQKSKPSSVIRMSHAVPPIMAYCSSLPLNFLK